MTPKEFIEILKGFPSDKEWEEHDEELKKGIPTNSQWDLAKRIINGPRYDTHPSLSFYGGEDFLIELNYHEIKHIKTICFVMIRYFYGNPNMRESIYMSIKTLKKIRSFENKNNIKITTEVENEIDDFHSRGRDSWY